MQNEYNSPTVWGFSGCYPYTPTLKTFNIAREFDQHIINFKDDILGLILPYTGFDYPVRDRSYSLNPDQKFLHLYNTGDTEKTISGIVEGISFTTTVPCCRKIILTKNIYCIPICQDYMSK